MKVTRKNKNSKKTSRYSKHFKNAKNSKNSKNGKNGKKTHKHMRNMRGSGGDGLRKGVNQAVDFFIHCGEDVLVKRNTNVAADREPNLSLIGTFASSGKNKEDPEKGNTQAGEIDERIKAYNINNKTELLKLSTKNALFLLKKDLMKMGTLTPMIERVIETIEPPKSNLDIFYDVEHDKRLTADENCKNNSCTIKTQIFEIKVEKRDKDQDIFNHLGMEFRHYEDPEIFEGHRKILQKLYTTLNMGVNQAVDFVIHCGDEVLVKSNTNVTNDKLKNFALIGTFASSGKKDGNTQSDDIKKGIEEYNKENPNALVKLTEENALKLLKKDIDSNMSDSFFSLLKLNIKALNDKLDKFYDVENDKRLNKGNCEKTKMPCTIKTQIFEINVSRDNKVLFEKNGMVWKKYTDSTIFKGHSTILEKLEKIFTIENSLFPGINQAVDFLIHCGEEVLVKRNSNVVNNRANNFALIGTFASSGKNETEPEKGNTQSDAIKARIKEYNEGKTTELLKLTKENALKLLKKDLKHYINDKTSLNTFLDQNIKTLDGSLDKFYDVNDDKRLSYGVCADRSCKIKTQIFVINVLEEDRYLFTKLDGSDITWKPYNSSMIFKGHKHILHNIFSNVLFKKDKVIPSLRKTNIVMPRNVNVTMRPHAFNQSTYGKEPFHNPSKEELRDIGY